MGGKARSQYILKDQDYVREGYVTASDQFYLLLNAGGRHCKLAYSSSLDLSLPLELVTGSIWVVATEVLHGEYGSQFDIAVVLRDGEVLLVKDGVATHEHVRVWEAKRKRSLWRGNLLQLKQVGDRLFAIGERGQIYYRPIEGGWKPLSPPQRASREQGFLDVAAFDGQLFVGGFETLDEEAWKQLEGTLDAYQYYTKREEKRATLWRLAPDWQAVPVAGTAEACVALQASDSGPIAWLSSGERQSLSDEEKRLDTIREWSYKVVVLGTEIFLKGDDQLYRFVEGGEMEPLYTATDELRLLGASQAGIVAKSESGFMLLRKGATTWRALKSAGQRASRSVADPCLHESYTRFQNVYSELYGTEHMADANALAEWIGVSEMGPPMNQPEEEESTSYWLHNLASLYGPEASKTAAHDPNIWGEDLWSKGWPIGIGYDGSHFIQSIEGDIYHVFGDEWIEAEAREELTSLSTADFFNVWGHHWLASDFIEFYRILCEQRGAKSLL